MKEKNTVSYVNQIDS